MASWLAVAFQLDDHLDTQPDIDHRSLLSGLASAVSGSNPARGGCLETPSGLLSAFSDLYEMTTHSMAAPVRERFAGQVQEYLQALATECRQRRLRIVPSERDYIRMRRTVGAVREAAEVADHFEGQSLPDHLFTHPWHQQLLDAAADVVGWRNDLASWHQEATGGEVHNLVLVLAHTTGCSPEHAADQVRQRLRRRAHQLEALASRPPHPGLAHRAAGMRQWAKGYRRWSADTGRY
ncbi:terpene synthase family protein [Streptomyces sp. NPDC127068]|uniref:terpene synthase family protein n=1 Tax=Streptomyces sp. NPDC127068 TaxID=3347127 RepID=UPI00364BEFA8